MSPRQHFPDLTVTTPIKILKHRRPHRHDHHRHPHRHDQGYTFPSVHQSCHDCTTSQSELRVGCGRLLVSIEEVDGHCGVQGGPHRHLRLVHHESGRVHVVYGACRLVADAQECEHARHVVCALPSPQQLF